MYLSQGIFGFILFSIYYYDWIIIRKENKKREFNMREMVKDFYSSLSLGILYPP